MIFNRNNLFSLEFHSEIEHGRQLAGHCSLEAVVPSGHVPDLLQRLFLGSSLLWWAELHYILVSVFNGVPKLLEIFKGLQFVRAPFFGKNFFVPVDRLQQFLEIKESLNLLDTILIHEKDFMFTHPHSLFVNWFMLIFFLDNCWLFDLLRNLRVDITGGSSDHGNKRDKDEPFHILSFIK